MAGLAHLSDLHLGASRATEKAARALVAALLDAPNQHVVVTGDVTDRGRRDEAQLFFDSFAPLEAAGRLTVAQSSRASWNRLRAGAPHPALFAPVAPLVLSPACA